MELAASTLLAYDKTDSLGFTYRYGWKGSGLLWGLQGNPKKDCSFTIKLTGIGGFSTMVGDVDPCSSSS